MTKRFKIKHHKKPSKTACKVAMNILTLGTVPDMAEVLPSGIVDATERLLVSSGAASATSVRWARSARMVSVYEALDWMMPGQFKAFGHRKAFCEQQVREGIAAGATEVLVLGAGYDTMGWRLAPEFPDVAFFEIDHPATARVKRRGIEGMGKQSNLHLITADLGERKLIDVLIDEKAWNMSATATIIAEGLLQYLSPQTVQDLLYQCAAISDDGRMAFTYVPTREDGRPDAGPRTGLVLWLLKVSGEPWLWSARPDELGQLLKASGWKHAPELAGATVKQGVERYAVATKSRRPSGI